MKDFLNQIMSINSQIVDLQKKRNNLVNENSKKILNEVFKMMDWRKEDLSTAMVEYSDFEGKIMITVWLKTDKNARYVFSLGKSGSPQLRFREDFFITIRIQKYQDTDDTKVCVWRRKQVVLSLIEKDTFKSHFRAVGR